MADAFDEVEESYRQERFIQFARKYWPYFAGAFVAMLLAVVGYSVWSDWTKERATKAALDLGAARTLAESGDVDGAKKAYSDLALKAPNGYRALAQLEQAGLLVKSGKPQDALVVLDAAARAARDPTLRDAVRLQAALIAADQPGQTLAQLEARVKPLVDEAGPWSFQARELLGMKAMQDGDPDRARQEFQYLSLQVDAPEGVRQRATAALAFLGPAAAKPVAPSSPSGAPAGAAIGAPADAPSPSPTAPGAQR